MASKDIVETELEEDPRNNRTTVTRVETKHSAFYHSDDDIDDDDDDM